MLDNVVEMIAKNKNIFFMSLVLNDYIIIILNTLI